MSRVRALSERLVAAPNWAQVVASLCVVAVTAFWSYAVGLTTPQWDFMASYLTEAHAWWDRGGILAPPSWISYAWMGYPADSNLQNSSYYLPVGVASLLGPYTPRAAAMVAAAHVLGGAFGAYLLVRRSSDSHWAGLFALMAWAFNPIAFSNGQHVDITRGAALLPWLLLAFSPLWPWRRRWSVAAAALIVWQFLVGAYPGQLVAAAYLLPLWVVGWFICRRQWKWALGSMLGGLIGLVAALMKFAPAIILGAGGSVGQEQSARLTLSNLASIFFPYDDPNMVGDMTMRSLFLVPPVLVLLAWTRFRSHNSLPYALMGTLAALVMVGTEVVDGVVAQLPGLSMSRFRVVDFKPFLALSLVGLAASALVALLNGQIETRWPWRPVIPIALALLLASTLSWRGSLSVLYVGTVLGFLVGTWMCVAAMLRSSMDDRRSWVAVLLLIGLLSGLFHIYTVRAPWATNRVNIETAHYGQLVSSIVSQESCLTVTERRPARLIPDREISEWAYDAPSLRGAFTCEESVAGYLNVKTNETRAKQNEAILSSSGRQLIRFFRAPGAVVPLSADGSLAELRDICLVDGVCTGLRVVPIGYSQSGELSYRVTVTGQALRVALNESFYPGWTAQICNESGPCVEPEVSPGPGESISLVLPPGTSTMSLVYEVPGRRTWMSLGISALAMAALSMLIPTRRIRRSRVLPRHDASAPAS